MMERGSGSVDAGNTSLMLFLLRACVFTVSCGITSQKARPNGRRRGREIKLESNNLFRSMNRTREGFIFFLLPAIDSPYPWLVYQFRRGKAFLINHRREITRRRERGQVLSPSFALTPTPPLFRFAARERGGKIKEKFDSLPSAITPGGKNPMEKGNRYERERGEDESKEEGIKREREREKERERERQTRARFSLLVSHGPVFMNGFARGLREIVLSLLPLLSLSLSLSPSLSPAVFSLSPRGMSATVLLREGYCKPLHTEAATIEGGHESIA